MHICFSIWIWKWCAKNNYMIQKWQKQMEKWIYEEEEKRKKGDIHFQLCIFPSCLKDRANGNALVIGMSRWHLGRRSVQTISHCWVVSRYSDRTWRPLQVAVRHFQGDLLEKFPYWSFLWVGPDLGLIQHLLIVLKGKEVFPYKRDFLHPNSLCVLSHEVLILIFLCSITKSLGELSLSKSCGVLAFPPHIRNCVGPSK